MEINVNMKSQCMRKANNLKILILRLFFVYFTICRGQNKLKINSTFTFYTEYIVALVVNIIIIIIIKKSAKSNKVRL